MELNFNSFEAAIKAHLDKMAKEDENFAVSYAKPNKSISECCKYICQEVAKQRDKGAQCVALAEAEVFGLAVHYYDEDDIVVTKSNDNVVVSPGTSKTNEANTAPEVKDEKPKVRKPRKAKVEKDPDIPEPLEIPIF